MNTYQAIALIAYAILLFFFFYIATNKFEKGWLTKKKTANKNNLDFNAFRLIAVVIVVGLVLIIKWLV